MNTGIQDAYNLAWKMALVLNDRASAALLDSYEAERRPVGADVVSRTREQSEKLRREERKERDRLADTQTLVNYCGRGWTKDDMGYPRLTSRFERVTARPIAAAYAGSASAMCSSSVSRGWSPRNTSPYWKASPMRCKPFTAQRSASW